MPPKFPLERLKSWIERQKGSLREVETKQSRVEDLVATAEYELGALRRELGLQGASADMEPDLGDAAVKPESSLSERLSSSQAADRRASRRASERSARRAERRPERRPEKRSGKAVNAGRVGEAAADHVGANTPPQRPRLADRL